MAENLFEITNIKAIIGLGNPGAKYYETRHSLGFRVVDALVDVYAGEWKSKDNMEFANISVCEHPLFVIKPQTFMNASGKVLPFLLKKGIKPEEILVVHDELEKPFGKANIKFSGSARGHNGLRSIMDVIGKDFWRLRFGIGRPENKDEVSNYVLSRFSSDEKKELDERITGAVDLIVQMPLLP